MKRKTLWVTLAIIAATLILLTVLLLWVAPTVLRQRYALIYRGEIRTHSERYDLDPYLVSAIIFCESSNRPDAVSHAGAIGLMQVMPATGEEIAKSLGYSGFTAEKLKDPELCIEFGCYYLREQMDRFADNEKIVLAAYNAGPNRAAGWLERYGLDSEGGICYIPYEETDRYVDRVMQVKELYELLYEDVFETEKEE